VDAVSAADVSHVLAVNVVGCFVAAREAVHRMSTRRGGRGGAIVNVSSAAARLGSAGEYVDYAASKGALDTMTVGLSQEVAMEGIRVNAVRPGFIYTEMHASGGEPNRVERVKAFVPMKRGGTAEEVAHAILWLLSDEASFTTGGFIEVAGGR
jgi:NAD(P)-dependent dehydrogenase (short-subunit alcohol dehydrogenase family)